MDIKQIYDITIIEKIHKKIFNFDFPIQSFKKKLKNFNLLLFIYEEKNKIIGYSIVVDQNEDLNLYAWYGGVIPEYQGNRITLNFFNTLTAIAANMGYKSITLASSNLRPHMLKFAIDFGFDIFDIKKREKGEGNKIYFRYLILPSRTTTISLKNHTPCEIEKNLVIAYKNNSITLIFENINENISTFEYAVKYCNSFIKHPNIVIKGLDFHLVTQNFNKLISNYKGNVIYL